MPPRKLSPTRSSKQPRQSILKGLSKESLKNIGEKIKNKFKWKHTPREFQLEAIKSQLRRRDVLIHAGTGSGKTFVAAGPHAHESANGKVTFMVSPLIALQDEQAETFRTQYGLSAIAINSAHGGCTKENMANISAGKWQIVVISPEMLLSKRFINNVLRVPEMRDRILSVVIDEAHVVSHWGSDFRKKYGTLGVLRALLPKGTPMVAMSATLPGRVRRDVLRKLQFDEDNYTYLNIGNDRPNVSLVVRAIQNPLNTFTDLDFVIPKNALQPEDVEKTFIYADSVTQGSDIMEHLYEISPESFREAGIIRTYNAGFSKEYRPDVLQLFREGKVRILICTDAAGMGCDIPDIDTVVQWKLPPTLSSFVQRAGRAARGYGRTGLAVLLVEKSAYDLDIAETIVQNEKKKTKKKGNIREATEYPKSKDKAYAIKHGVLRGMHNGGSDAVLDKIEAPLNIHAIDEGIYSLFQTMLCRRKVITDVYENKEADPTVPCCDLCCPDLLNKTRPAAPSPNVRKKKGTAAGAVDEVLKDKIMRWREEIRNRDFKHSLLGPSAILSDNAIESMSSFGPIKEPSELKHALGGHWAWFEKYGNELLALLQNLDVAPKKPKPPKAQAPKGKKRAQSDEQDEGDGNGQEKPAKRRRDASTSQNPTPVNPCPTHRISMPQPTPPQNSAVYSYPYSSYTQPVPQTPVSYHPYASAPYATPSSSANPPTPQFYTPIPYPYPYYHHLRNFPSSSQQPNGYPIHYQPPPPPPAPPST